jgi:hypothetical protein
MAKDISKKRQQFVTTMGFTGRTFDEDFLSRRQSTRRNPVENMPARLVKKPILSIIL